MKVVCTQWISPYIFFLIFIIFVSKLYLQILHHNVVTKVDVSCDHLFFSFFICYFWIQKQFKVIVEYEESIQTKING